MLLVSGYWAQSSNFLAPVIHCRHAIPPFANTACAQIWLLVAFGVLRVAMGKEESIQFDFSGRRNYNHNERRPVDPAVSLLFKQVFIARYEQKSSQMVSSILRSCISGIIPGNTNTWKHQAPGLGFNWPSLSQLSVFVSASDVPQAPKKSHRGL